jgi:uncharacterized protein
MKFPTTKLLMSAATVLLFVFPVKAQQEIGEQAAHTIRVSGDSEVKVVPDQAVIIIGVETINKSISDAKKENDKQVKDIAEIAARYGVQPSDIGTDYITANPQYDYLEHEKRFLGYRIRRPITITLGNVGKFDSLMTDLLESGITEIQNVQFQTTELRRYKDQARSMAIKAASEKAQALAAELGLKIGKAQTILEKTTGSRDYRSWYGYWGYGSWYGNNRSNSPNPFNSTMNAPSTDQSQNDDTPVALGKISISAGVEVVFELE